MKLSKNTIINKNKALPLATCKIVLNSIQKRSVWSFREGAVLPEGASQELWGHHGWEPLPTHWFITARSFSRSFFPFSFPTMETLKRWQSVRITCCLLKTEPVSPHTQSTFHSPRYFTLQRKMSLVAGLYGLQDPHRRWQFPVLFLPGRNHVAEAHQWVRGEKKSIPSSLPLGRHTQPITKHDWPPPLHLSPGFFVKSFVLVRHSLWVGSRGEK